MGRIWLINVLLTKGIINLSKPHHLLGASLVRECLYYRGEEFNFIETWDTSSPIVHGILGVQYSDFGNLTKPSVKLVDLIDVSIKEVDMKLLFYNLKVFAKILDI